MPPKKDPEKNQNKIDIATKHQKNNNQEGYKEEKPKLVLKKKSPIVVKDMADSGKVWNSEFASLLGRLYEMMRSKEAFRGRAYKRHRNHPFLLNLLQRSNN